MKKQAFNPYLPFENYIPDGEPHVFGDRVYIFGSHDSEGGKTFCENDYEFFSAPVDDLSDWTSNGINYKAEQDSLCSDDRAYMYAPDVVCGNDGKYYLYYCLSGYKGKGGYHGPISVAVSDKPDGKYEFWGHVKYKDGAVFNKYICFDPSLINDNGVIRLYYGTSLPNGMMFSKPVIKLNAKVFSSTYGKTKEELLCDETVWGANMLTLEDDMLTVKTDAVRIIPARSEEFKGHTFFEGASIRKIGDTYYFIYSSELNHELCYATSKYPDKGFVYGGTIVSAGDIGFHGRKEKDSLNAVGTTHGSIEKINGQWYVFYHRLTHASDYSRQGCAEKIYIENDGSIKQVEITSCGLNDGLLKCEGKYPAIIACNISNGKMPRISNRKSRKPIPAVTFENGERFVANIDNGTEVAYKYFDFQKSSGKIVLDVFSAANGTISIFTGAVKISEISISKFGRRQIESDFEIKTSKKTA